ncbi:hypothetical protein DdX_08140 [Ditylenchus destructor]|uniref:Uncharacterized protein n=1 Tax=Ditylenchus destructor TaxID=166010 RepID=A0AAD4N2L2_9BILA|nr:hypothetical protein DdX_08140 [Ditylenchus destructor]
MATKALLPILAISLTIFVLVRNSEALPAGEHKGAGTALEADGKVTDLGETVVQMDQPLEDDEQAALGDNAGKEHMRIKRYYGYGGWGGYGGGWGYRRRWGFGGYPYYGGGYGGYGYGGWGR